MDIPFVLKMWPLRRVAFLERDNLVVFHYLTAPEIWPDLRVAFCANCLIRGG